MPPHVFRDGSCDAILHLVFISAVEEGSDSVQKFVENNPEGPDICLLAVAIENHAFGGHVLGRSDV